MMITVCGKQKEYEEGITLNDLAMEFAGEFDEDIALAQVNNKIQELEKPVKADSVIEFLPMSSTAGHKAYVRTATMMLRASMEKELPSSLSLLTFSLNASSLLM